MPLQSAFNQLEHWLNSQIIGQPTLIRRMLIGLLCDGHLLVEGAPGLAKTRAIKDLASAIHTDFHRIQFTPDLLPSDVTGSEILDPESHQFRFQPGPIFHNLVLADEINRAPAKVQSALLEAMAERQVSVGHRSHPLPPLFMVMATRNPIEQEGTFPLPEAQLDRFLLHVRVPYPDADSERAILALVREETRAQLAQQRQSGDGNAAPEADSISLSAAEIFAAREAVLDVHLAEPIETYIVQLVMATRCPDVWDAELAQWLQFGASPRATLALDRCVRAQAWLSGRDHVVPDDVQALLHDVMRHRIIPSFSAEAAGIEPDRILDRVLTCVPVA